MSKKRERQKTSTIRSRIFYVVFTAVLLWALGDVAQPQATSCQVGTFDCAGDLYLSNGNVGIGTTSPAYKLDVRQAGRPWLNIENTNTATDKIASIRMKTAGAEWHINNEADSFGGAFDIWNSVSGHTVMISPASGNVGIGTTAPGAKLDVGVGSNQCCASQVPNISLAQASNTNSQMSWLQFHNAGESEAYIRLAGGGPAGSPRAGQRRLEIGDSQGVTTGLTVTGNVGIGTTAPAAKLDVAGDIRFGGSLLGLNTYWESGDICVRGCGWVTQECPSGYVATGFKVIGSGASVDAMRLICRKGP